MPTIKGFSTKDPEKIKELSGHMKFGLEGELKKVKINNVEHEMKIAKPVKKVATKKPAKKTTKKVK